MKMNSPGPPPPAPPAGVPLFHSGFNGTTRLGPPTGAYFHGPRPQYEELHGHDASVPVPHDWAQFRDHPKLGTFRIYYEGGDAAQRSARVLSDDATPDQKFLRFWIGRPNVTIDWPDGPERKARVQAELYGNVDLREVYQSVRVRLHSSLTVLRECPARIDWLTLMEYWNQPFWDDQNRHPYPFRISFTLIKPHAGDGPVYFGAHAQTRVGDQKFDNLWNVVGDDWAVTFGEWITLETYYREGHGDAGRFYVAVTPADGRRRVLFDVRNATCHPDNPAPAGLTHFNPMKVYTGASIVEFVERQGARLEVDWSDFSLWQNRCPAE